MYGNCYVKPSVDGAYPLVRVRPSKVVPVDVPKGPDGGAV